MNYISYQANDFDCGFVSLKMLLATLSKNKSYLYLEKEGKLKNFSFADLIAIAASHGLTLKGYEDEDKDLDFLSKSPALLLLDDGLTYNSHLVMVRKLKKEKVYFNDPLVGEVVMKEMEFLSLYTGKYLAVSDYQIQPFKAKDEPLVHPLSILPSFLLQVLCSASILMGLYFVKTDDFIFIPFAFLILFTVIEVIEKIYVLRLFKRFDENYLTLYMLNSSNHEQDFREYSSVKTLCISKVRNVFTSIVLSFSIIAVLIINDFNYLLPILLVMSLSVLDYLISSKMTDVNKFAREERFLFKKCNGLELGENLLALNERSNKLGINTSLLKSIMTFSLLLLSLAMMLQNKLVSTNYLIFTFGAFFILYTEMGRVLSYDSSNRLYQQKKERFLEKILISKRSQNMI